MSEKGIIGIIINNINEDSEAEKIGLKEGDIILKYDGLYPNGDFPYLKGLCERNKDRANIELVILRDDSIEIIYVGGGDLGINGTNIETPISPKNIEAVVAPSKDTNQNFERGADYQFRTLLAYGKFISGFGWLVVVGGAIAFFVGIANMRVYGIMAILGGIITLIMGIGLVANGQLISCFVSIESNTRKTNQLLESKDI